MPWTAPTPSSMRICSLAGILDAEAAADDQADDGPGDDDERGHDEIVGDDLDARWHRAAERAEQRGDHRAERSIHRLDDPEWVFELFH